MLIALILTFGMIHSSYGSELYIDGVKLYQEQRFVDALEKFKVADQNEPDNPYTLFNWGLSAFKMEQKGLAVGLWRRALFVQPEFSPAVEALRFARDNMPSEVFKKSSDPIENIKVGLVRRLSLNKIFLLNILLLTFSGWLLLRYLGRRKAALEDETPLPPFPSLGFIFSALFVLSLTLAGLKASFSKELRGTVIIEVAELKTSPNEDSNVVYSLLEGTEVIIESTENSWTLVTYPGGMTGWIPQESLFINSGIRKW